MRIVRSAAWILLIGLLAAAAQCWLVIFLARRTIVKPLQRLVESAISATCRPWSRKYSATVIAQ